MKTFNMAGAKLGPITFIQIYEEAQKLAPPRFLAIRMHPDRYQDIYQMALPTKSIQLGLTPGPLGKSIMRVACIKPPTGVNDGMTVIQDQTLDPLQLIFDIHGITEMVVENFTV
jgi:hypothetical protein